MKDIICVGAGISGSLFCHQLHQKFDVLVVDKARGPGGRMSTKRIEKDGLEYRFDHGAQFFTARDESFQNLIKPYLRDGSLRDWHSEIPHAAYEKIKQSQRFIGKTGMNALVKALASPLATRYGWECKNISYEEGHWTLISTKEETLRCKTLILSSPLPQSLRLLSSLDGNWSSLEKFSYRPVWAVLLGAKESFKLPPPSARWLNPKTGIEWISDNQKKGISKEASLTVHLTEEKSLELLEASPETVIEFAKSQLKDFLPKELSLQLAHRWLYSRSETARLDPPFYFTEEPGTLYLIGDAFGGGRVEGAALSALAASQQILGEGSP